MCNLLCQDEDSSGQDCWLHRKSEVLVLMKCVSTMRSVILLSYFNISLWLGNHGGQDCIHLNKYFIQIGSV